MTNAAINAHAQVLELNRTCECIELDVTRTNRRFADASTLDEMSDLLTERPHLFAATAVFVSPQDMQSALAQIIAIEEVSRLPGYIDTIRARTPLGGAPGQGARETHTRGLSMGYDFHPTDTGPRLIEINTNAGGAFIAQLLSQSTGLPPDDIDPLEVALNASRKDAATRAQQSAAPAQRLIGPAQRLISMFESEWLLAGRVGRPRTIAIVDEEPTAQYLYPDMLLTQGLLRAVGFEAILTDPASIDVTSTGLASNAQSIDFIYNRLTDFDLSEPAHRHLRDA
jgi:hypothetical protein